MWKTKKFKTFEAMNRWLWKHEGKIQYNLIFIENGYAIEWRKLVSIRSCR